MALSPAYEKYPEHVLAFDATAASVRVFVGDTLVAETRRGLNLREGRYPAVVYVPRDDVRMALLGRSEHTTHCPFKGDASYFDFAGDAESDPENTAKAARASIEQIAWSYEEPFDQMLPLRGALAFYADKVRIEIVEAGPDTTH